MTSGFSNASQHPDATDENVGDDKVCTPATKAYARIGVESTNQPMGFPQLFFAGTQYASQLVEITCGKQ